MTEATWWRGLALRFRPVLVVMLLVVGKEAQAAEPCDVDPAIISELFDWIDASTSYDVEGARASPPEIFICETGETIDYEGSEVFVDPDIRGLYDLTNRRIVLSRPWDPEELEDRSVLLHELLHHVQWTSRSWPCPGAPEWETY